MEAPIPRPIDRRDGSDPNFGRCLAARAHYVAAARSLWLREIDEAVACLSRAHATGA